MSPEQHCLTPDCPTENDLVAMLEGMLSPEEVDQLQEAIDRCPACQELFVALGHAFAPDEPDEDALPSGNTVRQQIHQYHIIKELGAGGMGVVYEAFDNQLQRSVALKLLRPDVFQDDVRSLHASRLVQEARLLARLVHPHIPTVYEVGVWNDQIFMAIQLVRGRSLKQWLRDVSPSWEEIVDVYLQVGRGIQAAHEAGIVHRDIKPGNILLDRNGHAYITDFGLASERRADHSQLDSPVPSDRRLPNLDTTQTGMVLGTPAYMSPEQRLGLSLLPPSDQYSFCVSLYESLCGISPFSHVSSHAVGIGNDGQEALIIPKFTDIPVRLFRVLERGLQRMPIERYGSMRELLDALEHAKVRQQAGWMGRVPGGKPFVLGFGAGLALLVTTIGFLSMFGPTPPPKTRTIHQPMRKAARAKVPVPRKHTPAPRRVRPSPARRAARRVVVRRVVARRRANRRRRWRRRRRTRKRRRLAMMRRKPILRPQNRGKQPTSSDYNRGHKWLQRGLGTHSVKLCRRGLAMMLRYAAHSKHRKSMSHMMKLYRGQCMILSGKCKQGGQLIREYQNHYSANKKANEYSVKMHINRLCPLSQGNWHTRLERFADQMVWMRIGYRYSMCRRLSAWALGWIKKHRRQLYQSRHDAVRKKVMSGLWKSLECLRFKKKRDCALAMLYKAEIARLQRKRVVLSRETLADLESDLMQKRPLCR